MTLKTLNPFPIWTDLWYAHAIVDEENRFVDACYYLTPERLLEFVNEHKHSVRIELYFRPKRRRGMPRFQPAPTIHVATYYVESKHLEIHNREALKDLLPEAK